MGIFIFLFYIVFDNLFVCLLQFSYSIEVVLKLFGSFSSNSVESLVRYIPNIRCVLFMCKCQGIFQVFSVISNLKQIVFVFLTICVKFMQIESSVSEILNNLFATL